MVRPTIETIFRDPTSDVTYHILAYRRLTPEELVAIVEIYGPVAEKKPESEREVTIVSAIGCEE